MLMTTSASRSSRRFVLAFAGLLALVLVLIGMAYRSFRETSRANRWSLHTYEVLASTGAVREGIAEMEAGYRGYALTRDPRFLQQWRTGVSTLRREESVIRRLTRDSPEQQARLDSAEEHGAANAARKARCAGSRSEKFQARRYRVGSNRERSAVPIGPIVWAACSIAGVWVACCAPRSVADLSRPAAAVPKPASRIHERRDKEVI